MSRRLSGFLKSGLLSRREALISALLIITPQTVFAQGPAGSSDEDEDVLTPPELRGVADFAGAWERVDSGDLIARAPPPDLPLRSIQFCSDVRLSSSDDISLFFQNCCAAHFNQVFAQSVSGKGEWAGTSIERHPDRENLFETFWDLYLSQREATLLEFLMYSCIFIKECGGVLKPRTEKINRVNASRYPGTAYLFSSLNVQSGTREYQKKSYNQRPNRTALECFNDPLFVQRFQALTGSLHLANTTDIAWAGTIFPTSASPTNDPVLNGFLLEADFYKFRGRGLIQTTWRDNYAQLIPSILSYKGMNQVIKAIAQDWGKYQSIDDICTISSNRQWDALFAQGEIYVEAVRQHAERAKYMPLGNTFDVLNGDRAGSLIYAGKRITGSTALGWQLKGRVGDFCRELGFL